ncbi:IS3 family transposase [Luteimicrobium subarcticum]|uniref:IS3 family transposase n=1 Tax=Luteimicrobium subarcticum TaxID=620910 RepID=UPI000C238961|nr:IS3 family transposase [Luteimicrobium subarcticum]
MARKNYSEEFRRQAVDLYESTPGATVRGIAGDLGVVRGTLRAWLEAYGTGKETAADGTLARSPLQVKVATAAREPRDGETPEQKVARLEARVRELEVETTKLVTEREILQKAAKPFRRADALVSRFQFVADHSATFEVKRLCQLLEIKRSSYYAWRAAAPARAVRAAADAALASRIRVVHGADNTVGAPRMTAELNDGVPACERVNHKRVARVMRTAGIAGYVKKRRVRTTVPEPADQKFPDLLGRDFTADAPNRKYVGDITYLPISAAAGGGNLYLATVIDCYSRRLVGWAVADHMRTDLVADALTAAAGARGSLKGSVFHSDHGSVYCSKAYAKLYKRLGVTQSMGAVGTSADNALAESFNATLKREVLQDAACWPDEATCRREVFRWIIRYNNRRRHSWCGYVSPADYENITTTTTLPSAA